MVNPPDASTAVDAGTELLDDRVPGWHHNIQLSALIMADGCRCVLGQLFGTYFHGIDVLWPDEAISGDYRDLRAQDHGFVVLEDTEGESDDPEVWAPIQIEWSRRIYDRQQGNQHG